MEEERMEVERKKIRMQLNSPIDPTIEYVDKPLSQVISELTKLLDSIPVELRDTATFKMYQWGDSYLSLIHI